MARKELNPLIRLLLEIGPLVAYFWSYSRYAETPLVLFGQSYSGIVASMVIFIPTLLISIAISYAYTRQISPIHIFSLVMVAILGGLTVYFNNDTFTKLRPTIVNLAFGLVLLLDVFVFRRGLVRMLLSQGMQMTEKGWTFLSLAFAGNFFAQAAINEIVRNFMSDGAFVFWDTFGQLALSMVILFGAMIYVSHEIIHPKESDKNE